MPPPDFMDEMFAESAHRASKLLRAKLIAEYLFAWENQVMADRDLPPIALHLVVLLRERMKNERPVWDLELDTEAKQSELAETLRVCVRTVGTGLDALERRGHLDVRRTGSASRFRPIVRDLQSFADLPD